MQSIEFRELSDITDQDKQLFEQFYHGVYVPGFPDPDERESLQNLRDTLRLKQDGWYGDNNYHILLVLENGEPIGCSVSDYLAEPNSGVIEYLLIDKRRRGNDLGRQLHDKTVDLLNEDARRAGKSFPMFCIALEMNNPFKLHPDEDSMDPFVRTRWFGKMGYGGLGFPYVQPALSDTQGKVTNLILGAKPLHDDMRSGFPIDLVRLIVSEYIRLSMRIPQPTNDPAFHLMFSGLDERRGLIPWTPFGIYLGEDTDRPFRQREIDSVDDSDFVPLMGIYRRTFPPGPIHIDQSGFEQALDSRVSPHNPVDYHLWALRPLEGETIAGLVSFFTFPNCGFVGYMILEPPISGNGRLPLVIAKMEQQMVRDCGPIVGWFFETSRDDTSQRALLRFGFHLLNVHYVPPSHEFLGGEEYDSKPLSLLFKPMGRVEGKAVLTKRQLLASVSDWLLSVYEEPDPESCETWKMMNESLRNLADDDNVLYR